MKQGLGPPEQPCGKEAYGMYCSAGDRVNRPFPCFCRPTIRRFIHGDRFNPQIVNHGIKTQRLALVWRTAPASFCWQFRKASLNPALPRPTTTSILDSNIYV